MIYFVPTPIGNLNDITLRALKTLEKSDVIACEDTRTTQKLLEHYDIKSKLISYHKFNEKKRVDDIIQLALENKEISIVSDAGMPCISDPGNLLIRALIENNIKYTVLPGPTAFTTALVMSGFDNEKFTFLGFIPTKSSEKKLFIKKIKESKETQIFYESPHRIIKTLEDLSLVIPNRKVCVIREISKIFEEINIFSAKDFDKIKILEKGELVVLIDKDYEEDVISDEVIIEKLKELLKKNYSKKSAIKELSKDLKVNKNKIYEIAIKL